MPSFPHGHRSVKQTQEADDITLTHTQRTTPCILLIVLKADSNEAGVRDACTRARVEIAALERTIYILQTGADLEALFVTLRVGCIITAVRRLGLFSVRGYGRHH